ncbi:MAG: ATP phosphoribosyltransferase [Phycisphaerales bacterium]|nr:ATP phosphoribosyltransferase [Phycisphaerales bacterium]
MSNDRTTTASVSPPLRLALPKGRMQEGIFGLLAEAGIHVRVGSRGYRPQVSLAGLDAKILKPQNVVEMLAAGSRDVGFAGADWIRELNADVVEVLDTGLDAVRLVAAAPPAMLVNGSLPRRSWIVASEYERITREWIRSRNLDARLVRSYGATEVFPPEDADFIVDIAASGETLRAQNLVVFDELMVSSTRLYASSAAWQDPIKRAGIERLAMLLASVLEARRRVMLEVNVSRASLERVIAALPCMREPTISTLHGDAGYAVKAAVPRADLPTLIPEIKARGGTDIVVTQLSQIIP